MKVNIKHGKKIYEDIDLDTSGDVESFKALVYSITLVPPERQKLMAKGM